ncbi:MAG: Methyl-accepting chemotaxis protein PctC [Syntrophorhabdaceae bacterium PtaU1.Bin034]|nr:MAG: Methyl-accepting chemotaxis protein PctC [Syntrophorhabdaceae bacterium PtaU1.Bin034]
MRELLGNLKMAKKVMVSPVIALMLMVIFGLVAYGGFFRQQAALEDIFTVRFRHYQASAAVVKDLAEVHANVYKAARLMGANQGEGRELERVIAKLQREQHAKLEKAASIVQGVLKSGVLTKTERNYFVFAADRIPKYQALCRQAISADTVMSAVAMSQADDAFQEIVTNLQELVILEEKLSSEQYASSERVFKAALVILALLFVAAAALSLGISLIMKGVILTPIQRTVEAIENIAQGDLRKRIDVTSKDEIGRMAEHFNAFAEKLRDAITHVADSSNQVLSSANEVDSASNQIATRINEAAVQVNSVAAASEEMSQTSSEIARNCMMAAKSADQANFSANTGYKIIQNTIVVMNSISDRVKDSSHVIKGLGERSEKIGEIVNLINDIADQTNLLALNAAIEAAAAGEQGRGFAVVAEEVRNLAKRTANATKEIGHRITTMQTETKHAVASMDQGVSEVEKGTSEAARSGEALQEILSHIGKVTQEINQIAVASEEETATTTEIAGNIQQISAVIQETTKRIQDNAKAASQLADLSEGLQKMVDRFQI